MGRLFWKFFAFCLLAQLLTIVIVSAAIHFRSRAPDGEGPRPPPPSAERRFDGAGPQFEPRAEPRPGPRPGGPPGPPPRREFTLPIEPLAGGVLASLVFAAFLAWYVSTPIRSLRAAFDAAARGDLNVRLTPLIGGRRDELADLARDFDRTSQQLKALMEGQRRLLHDVSHELRSPLARLQMAVGLARQQPEQIDTWFERIDREAVRMDKLVDELLTLSRLEAGVQQSPATTVDVGEVVHDVLSDAQFEAEAQARQLHWRVAIGALEGATIAGHAELLHRAIENVVRNAVKHAPDGGEVAIEGEARDRGREVRLAVQDSGPGVPQGELAAIFQPFFRGAAAKGTDGHGVGLAIAQSIVALHAGTIAATNRPEGGLRVEIVLPARKGA